jgi:hypothetical protein
MVVYKVLQLLQVENRGTGKAARGYTTVEKFDGRLAMMSFVFATVLELATGPGIFTGLTHL